MILQAPAPNAAPISTATTIPVLTIPFNLTDLSLDAFDTTLKQQFTDAIQATLPDTANVNIFLLNIRAGSVLFDTYIQFLDGNSSAATTLVSEVADAASVSMHHHRLPSSHSPEYVKQLVWHAHHRNLVCANSSGCRPHARRQ